MPDDAPRQLLERDRELELAGRLLDRVRRGGGGLLLVLGPAGIGKTALCRELARRARAGGATVLRAAGDEQASSSAFGVVRELFAPHVAAATGVRAVALRRGAAGLAWRALGMEGATPAADEHGWRHGLYWLCVELASAAPLVLVVDDLQWADPPSLGWLDHLARRVEDVPVLVVAAARDTPPHPRVEELAALPDTTVALLRPLGRGALATLTAAYLGPDAARALAQRCLEVTGGNPFLARQLLRALAETPAAGEHADLAALTTPELTGWVRARLARLSPEAGALARALAVLGAAPDLATAAAVAGIPAGAAPAVTDELAGAGLLTGVAEPELAHALLRGAALATIPPARRAELHGRAARALAGAGVAPARLAEHLTATIPAGDPWVVDRLLAAAGDALAGGDPAGTRRLVERALREPLGERERAALLRLDGLAALRLGDPLAVDRLREALALTPDPAGRAPVVRALLQGLLAGGRVAELADTAAAELAGIAAHDPDAALAIEAEVLSASRHTVTAALWNAQRLRAWRDRLGDRRPGERLLLANVASQIALDGGCAADAAQAALRALGGGRLLEEQTADAMPVYQAVWVLIAAERLQPAQTVLDQALDRAAGSGSPVGFALASLFRSYLELARGDLPRAEAEAQSALDAACQLRGGWFALPAVVAGLLDVLIERDRLDDGRRLLERTGTAADLPDSTPARLLLCSRGRLRLALGRVEEAVGDILELERRERQWHVLAIHLVPRHETAAVGLAAAGDLRGARRHARLGLQAARRWGGARTVARALRVRASLEPPAAAATLEEAVVLLEGSPARLDLAWALHDLGRAAARSGEHAGAERRLRAALDLAHHCGAVRLQAQARRGLVELGHRPRRAASTGVEALTGSERRVAELAAAGRTNREIAQLLFVTERTVEVHLTSAYRKLGIRSRRDLPPTLRRR
jgi:DNA-binding CsgD family transcriptional regulator